MSVKQLSRAKVARQQALSRAASVFSVTAWTRSVDPDDFGASWLAALGGVTETVSQAQLRAASDGQRYVTQVVEQSGETPQRRNRVNANAFAGVTGTGQPLNRALYVPVITAKQRVAAGYTSREAIASAANTLSAITTTAVQDAGRGSVWVSQVADDTVTGYTREVEAGACARCAILAGAFYRWSEGFLRHPNCNCIHVPATRGTRDRGRLTDPQEHFDGLSDVEQDRIYTKAGAEAIREGADIGQVVNARKGMATTNDGRTVTSQGSRRGSGERLMPEQIMRDATSRADVRNLLVQNGYLQ